MRHLHSNGYQSVTNRTLRRVIVTMLTKHTSTKPSHALNLDTNALRWTHKRHALHCRLTEQILQAIKVLSAAEILTNVAKVHYGGNHIMNKVALMPLRRLTERRADDDVLRTIGLTMMASKSGTSGLPRSWSLRCDEADLSVTLETSPMTYGVHPATGRGRVNLFHNSLRASSCSSTTSSCTLRGQCSIHAVNFGGVRRKQLSQITSYLP